MFKLSMQYFVKTHLFDIISFQLLYYRRSYDLVKRNEFDHIIDFLHSTHTPFHIIWCINMDILHLDQHKVNENFCPTYPTLGHG